MLVRRRKRGMTLIEMLAAIVILAVMTVILAQVFSQASRAASKGKGLAEVYQVSRALQGLFAKDLSGATPNFFAGGENSTHYRFVVGLPPGPYTASLYEAPFTGDEMDRMLMGGSDYLAFTSANALGNYRGVGKVFYVLRATGELVRVAYSDSNFVVMDYLIGAIRAGVNTADPAELSRWEERCTVAQNVEQIKFSYLDRSTGPISQDGSTYGYGIWVDRWDWNEKPYLPAAVKVQLQTVDHQWKTSDGDRVTNFKFQADEADDDLRASENFDPADGESFRTIIAIPLGMNSRS